jgi:hypothetical protein
MVDGGGVSPKSSKEEEEVLMLLGVLGGEDSEGGRQLGGLSPGSGESGSACCSGVPNSAP